MTNIKGYFKRSVSLLSSNFPIIGLFIILFCLFLINSVHTSYPDEFENILGGFYINQGRLPYIGFFTHHGPFTYFFASI